jgi:hypothetical protein
MVLWAKFMIMTGTSQPEDTTVFTAHPNATVWAVREATHCDAEHLTRVLPDERRWDRSLMISSGEVGGGHLPPTRSPSGDADSDRHSLADGADEALV